MFPCQGDHWNQDRITKSKIFQIKKMAMITSFCWLEIVRKIEFWIKRVIMWDFRLLLYWHQMLLTKIQLNQKMISTKAPKNWPRERKAEANSRLLKRWVLLNWTQIQRNSMKFRFDPVNRFFKLTNIEVFCSSNDVKIRLFILIFYWKWNI